MKTVRVLAAIVAIAGFGALAWLVGVTDIRTQLCNLRVVLPIAVAAGIVRLFLQTRAWCVGLQAEGIEVPQSRLIGIRLASQAAGYMTMLGPAVTEPAKLYLLRNPSGMAAAAPATLVETGAYWFTTVFLGLAGAVAGTFVVADSRAVWAAAVFFGVALTMLGTRRAFLPPLAALLGTRAPKWLQSTARAELDIRSFRDRHRTEFREVLVLDSAAQIVTLLEVFVALSAVGIQTSALQVLVIEAAGRMVKILGAWIPGRIGADEGGAAASFALLGLAPAAGMMLAISRRVRDVLFCLFGVVWAAQSKRVHEQPCTQHAAFCMEEN